MQFGNRFSDFEGCLDSEKEIKKVIHQYEEETRSKFLHRIHKDGGRAEEVWGELSAAWSRGVLGKSSV